MIQLRNEGNFRFALVLFAMVSGIVSLAIGLKQSLWFDEAYSVLLARHSWGDIVRLTAQDVHPPVYYWLLKAWMMTFGSSELALRSLSAVMLGLSVGMAGLLMRRIFGARAALIALPFVAFAPFLLRYGFEIRMYSFASLIGIVATYVLILALEAKTKHTRWSLYAIYSLLVALGVYTLYYMALVWITHFVWVAWLAYRAKRSNLTFPAVAAYAVSFVLFLPWLPIFLSKANGNTLSPVTHPLGMNNLVGAASFSLLYRAAWQLGAVWSVVLVITVVAAAYLIYRGLKTASFKERRYLALLGLYVAVPVIILVAVTHFRPVYIERYLAHFLIGGYMLLGAAAALAAIRGNIASRVCAGMVGSVLLLGCLQLGQMGNYNFQRVQKPSVKRIAARMADCRDGAVIFANDPQVAIELMYYVNGCQVRFYNETLTMTGGYAMLSGSPLRVADPAVELEGIQKLYYVYYDNPKRVMPAGLHRAGIATTESLTVATYFSGRRFAE